jgi:hypothetical protein
METNDDLEKWGMIQEAHPVEMREQSTYRRMKRRRNTQFKRRILLI